LKIKDSSTEKLFRAIKGFFNVVYTTHIEKKTITIFNSLEDQLAHCIFFFETKCLRKKKKTIIHVK